MQGVAGHHGTSSEYAQQYTGVNVAQALYGRHRGEPAGCTRGKSMEPTQATPGKIY